MFGEAMPLSGEGATETLQASLDQGLLVDGNGWSQLHRMRHLASQACDEAQALLVYRFVKADGVRLFSDLAATVQTWVH